MSALCQRLGRCGRRPGRPAQLRIYVEEHEGPFRHPIQGLHLVLVQAIAVVQCMATDSPPERASLAAIVPKPALAKYDEHLSESLLRKVVEVERLDVGSVPATAFRILARKVAL